MVLLAGRRYWYQAHTLWSFESPILELFKRGYECHREAMKKFALVIVGTLAALTLLAQHQIKFQRFDSRDGLASDTITSIVTDSLGYVWFGHPHSISRYDGYIFETFRYDKSDPALSELPPGELLPIEADAHGTVWFMDNRYKQSMPIRLTKYDWKTDSFIAYELDLEDAGLRQLIASDSGLWVGTYGGGIFSLNTQTRKVTRFVRPGGFRLIVKTFGYDLSGVRDMKDMGSYLLLATDRGLLRMDKATRKVSRPICNPRDSSTLYQSAFKIIMQGNADQSNTWLQLDNGNEILKIDSNCSIIKRIPFPEGVRIQWYAFDTNSIWFTNAKDIKSIWRFDIIEGKLLRFETDLAETNSLSVEIFGLNIDGTGNVWIITQDGVGKMRKQASGFHNVEILNLSPGALVYKAKGNEYLFLAQCPGENWDDPVNFFIAPLTKNHPDDLLVQKLDAKWKRGGVVQQVYRGRNFLWVAAAGAGGGVEGFPVHKESGMIDATHPVTYKSNVNDTNSLASYMCNAIWEDPFENLWVGHNEINLQMSGISRISPKVKYGKPGSVTHYVHNPSDSNSLINNAVFGLYPYNDITVWVNTAGGTDLMSIQSSGEPKFEHVFKYRTNPNCIFRASKGELYYGDRTGLHGLAKSKGKAWIHKSILNSVGAVFNIEEDQINRLWLTTDEALICYNMDEDVIMRFGKWEGIDPVQLRGTMLKSGDGRIELIGAKGITVFDPLYFHYERRKVTPLLTRLLVNNLEPIVGTTLVKDRYKIDVGISVARSLELDHLNNNFTLEFSAMDFTSPEKNRYRHKLEGYDPDWIETDYRSRSASYTNLDPGTYTFRVKASNHHGLWSDNERTLKVIILPPPWKTWWAYTGYALIIIALLFTARRMIVQRERLKGSLKLAKVEQEKEHFELEKAKEVDRVKTSFFTNISHEFRTPLTLIQGPVDTLLVEFGDNPKVRERLKLVQRNADLLLKLINQLLDLAKLEKGTMKVEKSSCDINSFIRAVSSSFESMARQKSILLDVDVPSERVTASFDKDKLETILINLINNAIKFTPTGGRVFVEGNLMDSTLNLVVRDTGIGIPVEQQKKIFERFHQISESHKEVGTGIGLALVKELVQLLGGSISLSSEPGRGTNFTVTLPIDTVDFVDEVSIEKDYTQVLATVVDGSFYNNSAPITTDKGELDRPHILVVEDNSDLRAFIIDSLGNEFSFLEADNGRAGLDLATNQIPDLIISDVMMPEMDGITMAGKIKSDPRSSHVPLILLTAKSTEDSKLQGLRSGADDYLTKPFNKNELLLKVRNSISRQIKLREKLRADLLGSASNAEVLSEDESFLVSVKEKILERLSNEQLSVESLAEDIGISRVHLYRKVSGLTGLSVNELIQKLRLHRAAQLLREQWGPVSQIAYEVGFSNLSYFNKVFREEFGRLPTEYHPPISPM
jgi:signal transduction histidine kinase/DNA-binding response OmpR family regulator/ligand-binding sensor domain-containing protein